MGAVAPSRLLRFRVRSLHSRPRTTDSRLSRHARPLHIGCFPHHPFSPLASEQFDGSAVVDMTELSLVDAVTAQFRQPPRKAPRGRPGNAELQILLLPHPAPAIGAGERETALVADVGTAA